MKEGQPQTAIYVCQGFECSKKGSARVEGELKDRFEETPGIEVIGTGCLKRCQWAPCVRVIFRDRNNQLTGSRNFFKVDETILFRIRNSTEDIINEVLK